MKVEGERTQRRYTEVQGGVTQIFRSVMSVTEPLRTCITNAITADYQRLLGLLYATTKVHYDSNRATIIHQ